MHTLWFRMLHLHLIENLETNAQSQVSNITFIPCGESGNKCKAGGIKCYI